MFIEYSFSIMSRQVRRNIASLNIITSGFFIQSLHSKSELSQYDTNTKNVYSIIGSDSRQFEYAICNMMLQRIMDLSKLFVLYEK